MCTEKRRQNKEAGKTRKFVSTTALVMQMKLRRCRNFYVFFHAGQSKFFGSLSNRSPTRTVHDEIIDRRVIFYFFFHYSPSCSQFWTTLGRQVGKLWRSKGNFAHLNEFEWRMKFTHIDVPLRSSFIYIFFFRKFYTGIDSIERIEFMREREKV